MRELTTSGSESSEMEQVSNSLPNAPGVENLVVPAGWSLSNEGIANGDLGEHFPVPVLITGLLGQSPVNAKFGSHGTAIRIGQLAPSTNARSLPADDR